MSKKKVTRKKVTARKAPTSEVSESAPQANVTLNSEQVKALDRIFPGFADPDKTAKDMLESIIVGFNDPNALTFGGRGMSTKDFAVASAYASIYTKVSTVRLEAIKELEKARNFYLVDVIINQFTEDSLNPELGTGNILYVKSNKKNIQEEIDYLDDKFDFDQLALSVTPDMLLYGEYTLKTKVKIGQNEDDKKKSSRQLLAEAEARSFSKTNETNEEHQPGLVDIMDSIEQGTVVALEKDGKLDGFLEINAKGQLTLAHPADYIKFSLGRTKIRIDLHTEFSKMFPGTRSNKKEWEKVPRFVRVGKSVIAPILGKIKELELLEALVPATKLNKLSNGTFLGMQLPAAMDLEKGLKAAQKVENLINKKVTVDKKQGELAIENIIATSGRTKVIPQFGDKGTLEKLDIRSDEPDELLSSVEEIRKTILDSVGVPFELIFKSDDGNRAEILKRYARYLRRLKQVQKALSDGLKQLVMIHLANKGVDFLPEDIEVEFINKLIEVDNLDHLEFMDTTVGMINNLKDFLQQLNEEGSFLEGRVNVESAADFITDQLSTVGLDKLILPKSKADPDPPDKDGGGDAELDLNPPDVQPDDDDEPLGDEPDEDDI